MLAIREANRSDGPALWRILAPMIAEGETYPLPRDMSEADAIAYWFSPSHFVFIAEEDGKAVGTYYLRANQGAGGDHVCNCGYVTLPEARGKGVARALCMHSLETARAKGFRAMQYNLVISTNAAAVHLWQSCGFKIVGPLPGAFRHPTKGFVDAYVMYQTL